MKNVIETLIYKCKCKYNTYIDIDILNETKGTVVRSVYRWYVTCNIWKSTDEAYGDGIGIGMGSRGEEE